MKITSVIVGIIAVILVGTAFYINEPATAPVENPNTNGTSTQNGGNGQSTTTIVGSETIRVTRPVANSLIRNPLVLEGQARGNWFFEASAPVYLLDANGKTIATSYIQAQGEWMTENFVPFRGTIQFATPETSTGMLLFENDNPSGLAENRREFRVPVRFDLANPTMEVKVFFSTNADVQNTCEASQAVMRIVPRTLATARTALNELFKGPTEQEKLNYGVFTSINPGVKINSLEVRDGVAYADFDSTLEFQVGGSCRVSAIYSQIANTLKQFPTVDDVVISINGRTEDILQP